MKITILVGNPAPKSKTRLIAERFVRYILADASMRNAGIKVVELSDYASELFDSQSPRVTALMEQLLDQDLIVVASPTYKATYTGLLKAFFDRYGTNAFAGMPCIPFMTGGTLRHALAVETGLRPLLLELGFSMATQGLFVLSAEGDQIEMLADNWLTINRLAFARQMSAVATQA